MMKDKRQAHLLMYDVEGRFLLQQRDDERDVPHIKDFLHPGTWGLFGGSLKGNETYEDCLKREILEELRYSIDSLKKYPKKGYKRLFYKKFDGNKKEICLYEGQGMGWFSLEEIKTLKLATIDRNTFKIINKTFTWDKDKKQFNIKFKK